MDVGDRWFALNGSGYLQLFVMVQEDKIAFYKISEKIKHYTKLVYDTK
jgi:hypothetical protein